MYFYKKSRVSKIDFDMFFGGFKHVSRQLNVLSNVLAHAPMCFFRIVEEYVYFAVFGPCKTAACSCNQNLSDQLSNRPPRDPQCPEYAMFPPNLPLPPATGRTVAAKAGAVPALLRLLADMSHVRTDSPADNKLMEDIAQTLLSLTNVGMAPCVFFF